MPLLFSFLLLLSAQSPRDFAGEWQQTGVKNYSMTVGVDGNEVRVHVTSARGHLDVLYQIGGKETVYTGLDGDEFHSRLTFEDAQFVFRIVEHERGEEIQSKEVWSLTNEGKTLKRVKGEKIYLMERVG